MPTACLVALCQNKNSQPNAMQTGSDYWSHFERRAYVKPVSLYSLQKTLDMVLERKRDHQNMSYFVIFCWNLTFYEN